jgi:predicted nuclease of predicted toxin-antitoxin system
VKLLFDENLSRRLVRRLDDLYPGSMHVSDADLLHAPDSTIWEFAKANELVIVTADADFFDSVAALGSPPKVIWLRRWIHPTRDAEALLRQQAIRIAEFGEDPELGILALDIA